MVDVYLYLYEYCKCFTDNKPLESSSKPKVLAKPTIRLLFSSNTCIYVTFLI